ncbi:hypothetical protein PVAND_001146 [Polypedilum vanderplanki]|uniref:Uncharacterized protein n=1 Tax=Polypedilum vanderplanki TaxID=319348 RepID=A0A9J6BMG2_POLVA|nr:hypothetical protein PVAND_001146 [Polypedilum vanderplanki]
MQGLLAKLSAQKMSEARSLSIASSVDLNDEDENEESDESSKSNTRNNKPKVKKDKEPKKQPGWNSSKDVKAKVGSRIDTNMVKLKLLDATRKAALTKKQLVSTAMQTDTIKTKLCKDVHTDTESLIEPKDQQTETEVDLIALKAKDGTIIITASVAANTDKLTVHSVSTQTTMPRSNVSFKRMTDKRHKIEYADDFEDEEAMFDDSDYDDAAMHQIEKIERRLRSKKKQRHPTKSKTFEIVIEDEASDVIAIETIPTEVPINSKKNSESEYEDSIQEDNDYSTATVIKKANSKRHHELDSTFNSWNDLNYDDEKVELPRSSFVEGGPTPWSNFTDLVLGNRFLNARLSPVPPRIHRPNLKQVTWNDAQVKIVNDLMQEATALLDVFDQVAMMLGPDIKLHNVSDVEEFKLPESKYNEEMTKSCEKLEASLKRLQSINDPKLT